MRIIFFDKVLFERTEEECETFKKDLIKKLSKLDDELKCTYPMKKRTLTRRILKLYNF